MNYLSCIKELDFLFQSGALYDSMTVRENLEFPLRRKKRSIKKDKMDTFNKRSPGECRTF